MMNLNAFFDRIRFSQPVAINLETVNALQTAFIHTVPFENLAIHIGSGIDYSSDVVFEKIVTQHRGGVCYESNSLFYDTLITLGFKAQLIGAAMFPDPQKPVKRYDHMAILVTLEDGQYVVDVGNGRNFNGAIPIDGSMHTTAEGYEYKIAPYNNDALAMYVLGEQPEPSQWQVRYALEPMLPAKSRSDFNDACHNTQTSPESIFVQKRLATLPKAHSRITLSDLRWTETFTNGETVEHDIDESDYLRVLRDEFGLNY